MFYLFRCEDGHTREYCISIKFGPPKNVVCDCKKPMYQEFGGEFILKGSWPGKDIKKAEYNRGKAREETEETLNKRSSQKRLANEVMKERRKGRKSYKQFKKDNPGKIKDYKKALKSGIRGE